MSDATTAVILRIIVLWHWPFLYPFLPERMRLIISVSHCYTLWFMYSKGNVIDTAKC